MADNFKLDSEKTQVPSQTNTSGPGLLDILGSIGSGLLGGVNTAFQMIPQISAYSQAAQGNVQPLQFLKQQEQKKNLLQQLQSQASQYQPEELTGYKAAVQRGDTEAAAKELQKAQNIREFEKVLPTDVAGDTEKMKRFKTLARLESPGAALVQLRNEESQKMAMQRMERTAKLDALAEAGQLKKDLSLGARDAYMFEKELPSLMVTSQTLPELKSNIIAVMKQYKVPDEKQAGYLKKVDKAYQEAGGASGLLLLRDQQDPNVQKFIDSFIPSVVGKSALEEYRNFSERSKQLTGKGKAQVPAMQQPPSTPQQAPAAQQGVRLFSPSQQRYFIQRPDGSIVPE